MSVRALGAFFLLTFAFSWLLWLPKVAIASDIALGGGTMETVLRSVSALPEVGAFGPSVAAFVLVYATHGRAGVSRLVGRALDRSFDRRWLVPIFHLFRLLAAVALGVAVVTGFEPSLPWAGQPVALPIAFVWILLFGVRSRRSSAGVDTPSSRCRRGWAHSERASDSASSGESGTCRGSTCPQ